jgi:mRNA interferase RelE/StbE
VKTVSYSGQAARDLKRHGNMAARMRKTVGEYAENPPAHANNVKPLVGSDKLRLRVGDYRVIFEADAESVRVLEIGPRGGIYGAD